MKNRYLKCHVAALICVLSAVSCSDFLGNKPKGYAIPKYYDDYALLLNATDLNYFGENYPAYITDDVVLAEKNVPDDVTFSKMNENERALYLFDRGDIFSPGQNDSFWISAYQHIYVYNVVANNILNVPDGIQSKKQSTWAEALMLRAMVYFSLVNVYAPAYNPATAATDYGVPLILDEDISKPYVRNTVAAVYEQMIGDLEQAAPLLPEVAANRFHPDRASAYTLLARIYLFKGDYVNALEKANLAYASNKVSSLMDLKRYTAVDGKSGGRLVDENRTPYPNAVENKECMLAKLPPIDLASSLLVSEELMDLFDENLPEGAVDKRKELFYAKDRANTNQEMEFIGYHMYVAHINPSLGVSYQELLLLLAECEARVGGGGSKERALRYLDMLRDQRISGNQPLTAADNKEALRITLDERRREMAGWSYMRFFDLKRLNRDPEFAKTVVHKLGEKTYSLEPNDIRYVMPLPHSVRDFNPNIPQYDR